MEVNCTQCNQTTSADSKSDFIVFVCPQCNTVYEKNNLGELKKKGTEKKQHRYQTIGIGQVGVINGKTYTVTGIMIKKAYGNFYWAEYNLEDANGEFAYLSEADGHWILLKEITDVFDVSDRPKELTYNDRIMDLYDYTTTELYIARGFFNFELPKSKIHLTEYILPPRIISIEKYNGTQTSYFGEHISSKAIANAFPAYTIPLQSATGLVQPFKVDVSNMAIVFCVITIIIFISHWIIYQDQTEHQVLSRDFMFSEFNGKEFVSESFQLTGGSAPLTVRVHSEVDNSWANLQVALVNEHNNESIYASKDVEYYHGNTDGENWSEGSTGDKFNICGVDAGNYHLVLSSQKAPEDTRNRMMSVNVVWNQPSMRNAWFVVFGLAIIVLGMYLWRRQFEQNRWAESNNSPYS